MRQTGNGGPAEQKFVLGARPPVRALGIASVTALVGALLLVLASVEHWSIAVTTIGVVLLAFAVALVLAALLAFGRLRRTLILDAAGIRLVQRRARRTLNWSDIDKVTLDGARLVLVAKDGRGDNAEVVNPTGPRDPAFLGLLAAIRSRLDADRGYGKWQ
jgi:hypothetical protein